MAELIHTICNHTKDVNGVAISPNCSTLVSVSGDKTICVWDISDGRELKYSPLIAHTYSVTCCAFSPFGSILATGSQDTLIILWDVQSGTRIKTLQGHTGIIRCCSFSWNSQYICSASSDETLRIWDMKSYHTVKILRGPEFSIQTCCFTPDDMYIISGSVYGDIRIWDFNTAKCEGMLEAHDKGISGVGITGCAFSPTFGAANESSSETTGGGESPRFLLATCGGDNLVRLWDVYTGSAYSQKCHFEPFSTLAGHSGHVWDCKFSSDGQVLVSCSSDKTIIIWNPLAGTVITKLSSHTRYITTVAISANSHYLASGSNDKSVQVWSLKNLSLPGKVMGSNDSLLKKGEPVKLLRQWTSEDVGNWLVQIGLQQYTEIFRLNAIDGIELLNLNDEMLAGALAIRPLGHRNKIMRELKNTKDKESDIDFPDEFLCPITRELMSDPVIAADGFTYERESISSWIISGKNTSPMTNIPFHHTDLIPNRTLKSAISRYFGPNRARDCILLT